MRIRRWSEVREELLKDEGFRKEYEALEPEYRLARSMLKLRRRLNLTQEQAARRAGKKQSYIARLESGSANPTIRSVREVAERLGGRLIIEIELPRKPRMRRDTERLSRRRLSYRTTKK